MKRCSRCKLEKPLDAFYSDRSQTDGKDRRCIECSKAHLAEVKKRNGDKMREARRKRHAERMENDPEYRERVRSSARRRKRVYRATNPELHRSYTRAYYKRIRNDPAKWSAFLEKKRTYIERLKTDDPEKYEALLEARRINNRLRRIEAGLPVRESKMKAPVGSHVAKVDSAPLAPMVADFENRYNATHGSAEDDNGNRAPAMTVLSERSGLSIKLLSEVRDGKRERIALDSADKICHALDVPLELVYMEEDEE